MPDLELPDQANDLTFTTTTLNTNTETAGSSFLPVLVCFLGSRPDAEKLIHEVFTVIIDIYDVDNSGSTPSTGNSDISKDMEFGRPFVGRPSSFTIDYSYTHVGNSNSSYPQKSLIYVILLSADSSIVAAGVKTDAASVNNASVTVPLVYGSDEGLLSSGYLLCPGLKVADATKEVAFIQVVFASSAYAHVVAGGTTLNVINPPSKKFRGGEGSALILDSFRLNY